MSRGLVSCRDRKRSDTSGESSRDGPRTAIAAIGAPRVEVR